MTYCNACGHPVADGAAFCSHCGKPLSANLNIAAAAPAASAHAHAPSEPLVPRAVSPHYTVAGEGNAITWPFHQKDWILSVWILLIGWFPLPFPFQLTSGWLLDAAARRARNEPDRLPRNRDLLHIWVQGFMVWAMLILFFTIPLTIISALAALHTAALAHDFGNWLRAGVMNGLIEGGNLVIARAGFGPIPVEPHESLAAFVRHAAIVYSTDLLAPFVYIVAGAPLFVAAALRYAVTGKLRSFFSLANFGFALRHFVGLTWLFLVSAVLTGILLFAVPMPGVFLWLTFGVWIAAYLAGGLARKWLDKPATDAVGEPALAG